MKIPGYFAVLFTFIVGVGCQAQRNSTLTNTTPAEAGLAEAKPAEPPPQPTYRVESIPTPRLAPTSRGGDSGGPVYSSNIIAVYVVQPGDTNAPAANTSEQGNK